MIAAIIVLALAATDCNSLNFVCLGTGTAKWKQATLVCVEDSNGIRLVDTRIANALHMSQLQPGYGFDGLTGFDLTYNRMAPRSSRQPKI